MAAAALAIACLMVGTWLLSLALRNASIVDIAWGAGFVVVAWTVRLTAHGNVARQNLLTTLVTIWGLRLAVYLFWRNHGKGEDFRYRAMRKQWGAKFPLVSLVTVFALQGTLMWIVSLGVQTAQARHTAIGALAYIGIAVWLLGLFFEVVGDAQLARFKANPDNAGKVMDGGLWRYTRHPNYFGDATMWWGIALIALETGIGALGILGAAVMSFFLVRISGVAMLERSLAKRKPDYAAYMQRTSAFIPRPPKG
jgi:steroid 5-alpha reductase family enzyme